MYRVALLALAVLAGCKDTVEADFTGLQLATTFPTGLGIDRLVISGSFENGDEALPPKPLPELVPNDEAETQTYDVTVILQEELAGQRVTFRVDGTKPEGVVATGRFTRRMQLGFVLNATVALGVPDNCGDGALDPAEQCDDANGREGDGCAANCGIEDGFICLGSPSECFVEARTAIIGGDDCPGQGTGGSPFCKLSSGVAAPWAFTVVVKPGSYGERIVIERDLELIGVPGAILEVGASPAIKIEGVRAVVRGFEIRGASGIGGGIAIEGPDAMAEVRDNSIGPGNNIGIDVGRGAFARIERNRIRAHTAGGLRLDSDVGYIVRNNVIVANGSAESFGGVSIVTAPANSIFANNTVVGNESRTSSTAAIECTASAVIVNSILWGQSEPPRCEHRFSDVGPIATSTAPLGEGSFSADPRIDANGILLSGSPCIDTGDPVSIAEGVAPIDDIDGDGRPNGNGIDVGADEY